MKIISKLFIIIYLILIINQGFAIEKSSINLEMYPEVQNTDKNIEQAESIENGVVEFKNKLLIIQKKYKLEKNTTINNSIKDLGEIIYILRKIQTTKINRNTAEKVIKIVINDLQNISISTKQYLKNIKSNLDRSKNRYNTISMDLYYKLNKITLAFIRYYQNKDKNKINTKDKEIIKIVQNIYSNSLKIKNFKNIDFYNKEDMKNYLINILNNIKDDFRKIREIIKKK
ncbi:MAG: hypothetical protein Q9M94_04175 [Candidatus Gracilibacteria bacterium]|nr:hypothetical protein [Candidatus Gracilibacteria bacterium]